MGKIIEALEGQTYFDISLQEYGDVGGIVRIAQDNPMLCISDTIAPGQEIFINGQVINQDVVDYFQRLAITPVSFTDRPVIVPVYRPAVLDWVARGGAASDVMLNAYNQLDIDLEPIRTKIIRLNLFASINFSGVFIPFYNGDGTTQIGSVDDINNNFPSTDYDIHTGLGNILNNSKYINTGVAVSTLPMVNSASLSFWSATDISSGGPYWDMGGNAFYLCSEVVDNQSRMGCFSGSFDTFPPNGIGFFAASRPSNNTVITYINGTSQVHTPFLSGPLSFFPVVVFGYSDSATPSASFFSRKKSFGYHIGYGLSMVELNLLYNALLTFHSAVGR